MTYARLGWQREFHDSLSNGQVASTSKPTVGAMNTPQSIPTQAFESHLTQVDPQVGITIHDSSGVCRAATASMSRILQIPLGKIRGATLGEICSLADPCLIEPDLLADVARIGSAVKSLRPHIPGSGPTPLELVAVKVTHEDEEATQIMWTPEAERIREVTLPRLMSLFESRLHLPRDTHAAARTSSRALAHFLDVDAAVVLSFNTDADQFEVESQSPSQSTVPTRGTLSMSALAPLLTQESLDACGILSSQFPDCAIVSAGEYRSIYCHAITDPLGTALGAVCLLDHAAAPPPDSAKAMVQLVAERLGILQSQTLLEENARRTHLLQSLDDLTGAHAHDLRNYLACIAGAAYQLSHSSASSSTKSTPDAVNNIRESTQAALKLVDAMVESTRQPTQNRDPIDILAVLSKCVQLIQPCARGVTFEVIKQGSVPQAIADEDQMTQVILNLFRNAVEAMNGTGTIKIIVDEPSFRPSNAPSVRFRIRDDGPGMPAEFRRRAFKPYATSSKKRGVGLGLTIAASLIREHNGRIEFENKNRAGTTVSVTLPAASARRNAAG